MLCSISRRYSRIVTPCHAPSRTAKRGQSSGGILGGTTPLVKLIVRIVARMRMRMRVGMRMMMMMTTATTMMRRRRMRVWVRIRVSMVMATTCFGAAKTAWVKVCHPYNVHEQFAIACRRGAQPAELFGEMDGALKYSMPIHVPFLLLMVPTPFEIAPE